MTLRGWAFYLAATALGCGGESSGGSASPKGGCATAGSCSATGGMGGGGGGSPCTGALPNPEPEHLLANWPMPNPPASGGPNPSSYDTREPDAVIDGITGLMWQQSASPVDEEYSFEEAVAYCADSEVSGHCDWRLPTRVEAASLVDFTRRDPAIDAASFSDFPEPQDNHGWTFHTSSRDEEHDWRLFFSDGASVRVQRSIAVQGSRARCVRNHVRSVTPEPRYLIEGQAPDDTVLDRGTGLVWQRRPSQQTYTFTEAQAHCENLELRGRGFRVPSMKEIQTVVDERWTP
ncbi:MAG TPA: DUF1566 domain-containing protein, partial [Polyangiaceae bacterium]